MIDRKTRPYEGSLETLASVSSQFHQRLSQQAANIPQNYARAVPSTIAYILILQLYVGVICPAEYLAHPVSRVTSHVTVTEGDI